MATHSSVLASRIPGTGEPGGLPSMGLHRVGHDWSDLAAAAASIYIYIYLNHFAVHRNYNIETNHTSVKKIQFLFFTIIYFGLHCIFVAAKGLLRRAVGCSLAVVRGPLSVVVSFVGSVGSRGVGSVVVAHGLSHSVACGIFLDQRLNMCPLYWPGNFQPLDHHRVPAKFFFNKNYMKLSKKIWIVNELGTQNHSDKLILKQIHILLSWK